MVTRVKALCIVIGSTFACGAAHAAPPRAPSTSQCEALQDDDAFNRCLASTGPQKRGAKRFADPQKDVKASGGAMPTQSAPRRDKPARPDPFLNVPLRR